MEMLSLSCQLVYIQTANYTLRKNW